MARVRASHFTLDMALPRCVKLKFRGANIGRDLEGVSPSNELSRPRRSRRLLLAWVVAMALLLAFAGLGNYLRTRKPLLDVPLPGDIGNLETQLRAYIEEKVQRVRESPREMQRYATLGIVYAANGLWNEAQKAFKNAAQLNPKEPLAQMYVGIATQESGDLDQALQLFRQLAVQFRNFAPAHYRLGHALLRAGALDEAESAFQRLIACAPTEWRGLAGLGDVKLRRGDYAAAVHCLEQAVRQDPSAKNAHHLLGMAYRGMGRMEDAALELRLGLNAVVFPMPDAWSETASQHMRLLQDQIDIANAYSQAGSPNKAVELLDRALSFHPRNLALLNNLAIAYNRSGQPQKARPLLQRMLQIDERYLSAHITLSFNAQMLGFNDEALAHAEKAIALAPDTPQGYLAKANVLLAMERDVEALAALGTAFSCDPQNAEVQIEMGDVCLRNLNRPAEAMEHYKNASKLDPVFAPVHVRVADLQIKLGETNEARASLQTLRRISPNAPELAVLEGRLQKLRNR